MISNSVPRSNVFKIFSGPLVCEFKFSATLKCFCNLFSTYTQPNKLLLETTNIFMSLLLHLVQAMFGVRHWFWTYTWVDMVICFANNLSLETISRLHSNSVPKCVKPTSAPRDSFFFSAIANVTWACGSHKMERIRQQRPDEIYFNHNSDASLRSAWRQPN